MGITEEELQAIMEEDQSHEHQQLPLPTESWNASLPILYDDVQCRVKSAAEWMKRKKATGIDHERIVERYLQLTNVLLGLRLWGDDIMVQGESALGTIENDNTGFEILAPRLRTCFQEMLTILVDGELFTETNNDFSEFDELEQSVQHLRNFASPLRTYQESAKNAGDVGAIRAAAAACLQKQSHLPTPVSGNVKDKRPGTPDKVSSHDQKPTIKLKDQEAERQAVESTPEDHLSRAWRLKKLENMLPGQEESSLDDLCSLCIQGYRSFQSMKSFGTEAQVILSKMEIQEYRLQALKQTLETIQRAADTRNLGLLSLAVYNTLESIKLTTTDTDHLRAQYNLKFEIPCSSREDDEESEPGRTLVKIRKPLIIKWLHFDETNMEKLAADLKMLTDVLEQFIAPAAGPHKMRPTLISAATALLATSDLRALANLAAASAQEYPELAADARRKLLALESDFATVGSAPRKIRLSVKDFTVVSFSGAAAGADDYRQRQVALAAPIGEVVLLEWQWLPRDNHRPWARAVQRLETASALLQIPRSATLRTLDCAGFSVEPVRGRAALVYRFPPGAARRPPTTLLRLLQDASPGSEMAGLVPPTLNDRCALALALAETVFRLHMSGWLHLSINAHNVLFFEGVASRGVGAILQGGLKTPFLTGFGFTGGDGKDPMAGATMLVSGDDQYRHPDHQDAFKAGFNKKHDLYSLGMVLLEIGFWKPFDRPPRYTPTSSLSENRDQIVRQYLGGHLAQYMGNAFETVVRTCITGDFGCDVSEDAAFQRRVYDVVVEPLKRLMSGL